MKRRIRQAGFTLMEVMVTISVAGFVFGFLGFLIFICSRSAFNMHDQVISQNNASTAAERVAMILRNAVGYRLVDSDAAGEVSRIYAEFPTSPTSTTTHTIALKSAPNGKKDICYYTSKITSWNGTEPSSGETPALSFRVVDFKISYQNSYRLILTHSFVYKGFAMIFHQPGISLHGDFITEAIAKNHFMGEGVDNYAQTYTGSVASY